MNKQQLVALVDPITGGHHLAYIRLMARAFLELGHEVWIFYPDAERDVLPWLKDDGFVTSVKAFDLNTQKKSFASFGHFAHAAETLHLWHQISKTLRHAEKKEEQQVNFVFFAWLDSFLANYLPYQLVDAVFPYKWSGLYFHPMYLLGEQSTISSISSIDYVLKAERCKSVFLQDEFLTEQLQRRIRKTVSYFPQITDQAEPDRDFFLCHEIKSLAKSRKIVGLIGLDKRKGLLSFMDLVKDSDAQAFYFFMAGPITDVSYSAEELKQIHAFLEHLPKNCYHYPNYLKEGPEINGVIDVLDIVYQVYYKFRSASNFTTKAAFLKKPVLAKEDDWIGSVTKKYELGVTVPENDPAAIARGLIALDDLLNKGMLKPDHHPYLEQNSYRALQESMMRMLS